MNNLAVTLRVARAMSGLSQEELAKKSGVNKCTICFIETGRTKTPSMRTLLKLADALEIDAEKLTQFIIKEA